MEPKKLYKKMKEGRYENEYGEYAEEIAWYDTSTEREWVFYIPSRSVNVRLRMDEDNKRVIIEERGDGDFELEFHKVGIYSWL